MTLKGKTALVTGSTSGIGLGVATRLASEGVNIVLNGFGDPAQIESLRKSLAAKCQVEVSYDGADMTRPDTIAAMVQKAVAKFGALDVLVNNAGIQARARSRQPTFRRSTGSRASPRRWRSKWRSTAKSRGISEEAVVRDVILAAQPTKQFVKVDEVAALAAYLCSGAAASITGALLSIDGGWTAE